MELSEKTCIACRRDTPLIPDEKIPGYLERIPGWYWNNWRIKKTFTFKDFAEARMFLNKVADLAEAQGHHPDMGIVNYREVHLCLWSYAPRGLTENDFILAAKINALLLA